MVKSRLVKFREPHPRRWLAAIAIMAVIFIFSSIPKGTLIPDFDVWDFLIKKSAHLLIYGLLALSYLWGLTGWIGIKRQHLRRALLMSGLYGISDEFHQTFIAGREGNIVDVAIDMLGAALALLIWSIYFRWKFGEEFGPEPKIE